MSPPIKIHATWTWVAETLTSELPADFNSVVACDKTREFTSTEPCNGWDVDVLNTAERPFARPTHFLGDWRPVPSRPSSRLTLFIQIVTDGKSWSGHARTKDRKQDEACTCTL